VWGIIATACLVWGAVARLDLYITPQRGLGYWLGIIGGSMMLLLLVYSARKRVSWLAWMGSMPVWFDIHMSLGVVGPMLVLFHSGFHLGATNSNVALISMLLVAGSGVVGRYMYTRIHLRLDGKEDTLEDLRSTAGRLRTQTTSTPFLPGLFDMLDKEEQRMMHPAKSAIGRFIHLFTADARAALARRRTHKQIDLAVSRAVNDDKEMVSRHGRRIAKVAKIYSDRRLDAARRVSEYKLYTKLFSLWHVLHIPLFFMLLIAGIVHVIAANVY
jgi:hypothetical protein